MSGKKRVGWSLLIVTVCIGLIFLFFGGERALSEAWGDVDGDGLEDRVSILQSGGKKYLIISKPKVSWAFRFPYRIARFFLTESYRVEMTNANPYRVQICEIDGNDEAEIFLTAKRSTLLHPEVINRPFFFNFRNHILIKKWTGSKFGDPFREVYFLDVDGKGRDEVFTVDELPNSSHCRLRMHYWFQFGFFYAGESGDYEDILSVEKAEDHVLLATVVSKGEKRRVRLVFRSQEGTDKILLMEEQEGL